MARWDDLHRAIEAKDTEGAERIWLELLETDLGAVDRFVSAARVLAEHSGGKRQGGILLWMLAESLKEKDRHRELIDVYVALSRMGPDDGTVRQGLVDAARRAYPERSDLDGLLEKSGLLGGEAPDLGRQAEALASYLQLEPGAYVFHKGGWGVGRIAEYRPDRGRCVIDFRTKPGHEMDLEAAATRLERLTGEDIRALSMSDPKRLRRWAAEDPLEMIRQVLARFGGSASLRHLKDALVPDAVPTSQWSSWWGEARRKAHLDPRFRVGGGREQRVEYSGSARIDFHTQVERTFVGCATVEARQRAARDFIQTAKDDAAAHATLAEILADERKRAAGAAAILGWDLLVAELEGADRDAALKGIVCQNPDPRALLSSLLDEQTRAAAARALIAGREDGPSLVYDAAMAEDDPVLADVGADRFATVGRPELLPRLLDAVDARPANTPNVWAWYLRGLRRERWEGRVGQPYPLVLRLLKVIDAVEYRARRTGSKRDQAGVETLTDALTSRSGELVKEAAEAADRTGARYLLQVLEQSRGFTARALQKIQAIVLRAWPDALRLAEEEPAEGDLHVGERLDRVYMTAAGLQRLREQRDRIQNEEIPANAAEIARAREFGDLAENAEYHAARERAALLQARVNALNGDLARAAALTPEIVRLDAVSVGARVRLKDAAGEEVTYALLGPPDVDVKHGIINYQTPLGQVLMGKKPGDHVRLDVHGEIRDFEVLGIENALAS